MATNNFCNHDSPGMKKIKAVKKIVKRRASHKAAVAKSPKESSQSHIPIRDMRRETGDEKPYPEDLEQQKRLNQLIEDVREAFTRNQFAIPGDIDLQVRGMAMLYPHHAPLPETQPGPGVVEPATEEAGVR